MLYGLAKTLPNDLHASDNLAGAFVVTLATKTTIRSTRSA